LSQNLHKLTPYDGLMTFPVETLALVRGAVAGEEPALERLFAR